MTTPKAKPLPTPHPWTFEKHEKISQFYGNIVGHYGQNELGNISIRTISCQLNYGPKEEKQANAEIIVNSVNAMQSAAQRLSMRPDDLAEALADGGIAEMVEALRKTRDCLIPLDNPPTPIQARSLVDHSVRLANEVLAKLPAAGKAGE